MEDVGIVCMRHPPCAGARHLKVRIEGSRCFPLWARATTFPIVIAKALPSVPVTFLDRFSVSRYDQLWLALFSSASSFRRGSEGNLL